MPQLDLFTLDVATIAITFVTGVALLLVSTLNRRVEGIKRCAVAGFLLALTFTLYPLRVVISGKFIVLLPNLFLFAGVLCILDGIRAFRQAYRPLILYAVFAVIYVGTLCYWLYADDNMNARMVVEALFAAVPILIAAWTMAARVPRRDRAVYWSTAAGIAIHGITLLARAYDALPGHPRLSFFDARTIDFVNFGTLNLAAIGCAFGLMLATNLKLQRETEKLALYDPLTNLPNRRLFEERLEQAERRAFETGQQIGLVYCDLDDFKTINDTIGHEGGDIALKMVADRLRGVVSPDVCLARVGGDEFLLLVENAHSREQMDTLISRVRKAVEGDVELLGRRATLKISCGLAIYPEDVGNASDLIRLADAAMYRVKQRGRFSPADAAAGIAVAMPG